MKNSVAFVMALTTAVAGGAVVKHVFKKELEKKTSENKLLDKTYALYYHWLLLRQNGINISDYFIENGLENIAVFDLSPQGRRFIDELKETDINVLYAIEKENLAAVHETLQVLRLHDDELPKCDAVIVCSLNNFNGIEEELKKELGEDSKIISLGDILLSLIESNSIDSSKGALDISTLKESD